MTIDFYFEQRLGHKILFRDTIQRLGADLAQNSISGTLHMLTDRRLWSSWGEAIKASLMSANLTYRKALLVPHRVKDFELLRWCLTHLNRSGVQRRDHLLVIGGGNIIDVGGLAASLFMRGIPYVNVPTTLVGQLDAAIGGKTGINFDGVKNLVGSFYYPKLVFICRDFLSTLSAADTGQGLAEAIKVAIIASPSLFRLIEANCDDIRGRPNVLWSVVRPAAHAKLELLRYDPLERDLSRSLNLGHTVAHAIEALASFEGLSHGEAVSVGLATATRVAKQCGHLSASEAQRILTVLQRCGLPTTWEVDPESLQERLQDIRRVRGGRLRYVIPIAVGRVDILEDVDAALLAAAVSDTA